MRLIVILLFLLISTILWSQDIPVINWDSLQQSKPWEKTEVWSPVPSKVYPNRADLPPSDAIILFGGHDLSAWCKPQYVHEGANLEQIGAAIEYLDDKRTRIDADWNVIDGTMVVQPGTGAIETKQSFGDVQLHIEWLSPADPGKEGQAYSNSGVFLMGMYEIQVLNSYQNQTYPNGQAGAIYKQHIPMVNASRPPGEWQAYDIVFTAPKFDTNGTLTEPALMTAFHNGVLIHHAVELEGPTAYIGASSYVPHPSKLPLRLQDHGDLVRFRNIWVREL